MPSKTRTKIVNVNVLSGDRFLEKGMVIIQNGKIEYVGSDQGMEAEQVIDGRGAYLVPGFIDLHVHGGAGHDFMDLSQEAVDEICRFHAAHGTTGLLATTMTAPIEKTQEVVSYYNHLGGSQGAQVLGLHLEGPFINIKYKGAQNGDWIEAPTLDNMKRVFAAARPGLIKLITLAPELIEDEPVLEWLTEQGTIASVGHSDLDYHGGCRCMKRGLSHATHLGNAMRGFHHRNIGMIGLVMEQPELTFDIIADGIHVSPELIRLLVRICSLDQIMLITDAMRAAGLTDGCYELGGQEVHVKGMEARLGDGVLAGSMLTLDKALANLIEYTGLPLATAVQMLTSNQARKLGLEAQKGSIAAGKDADLVLLSDDLRVLSTWVNGEQVYQELSER
ncbi:N-acetylglucosamine-6-phosphate deacetylase [Brevibacillus humidisoli]|uniref:N-acetylglucosamine-6-phosphate deacetylase n=1 Tax=Brevibacillus humidisoli TaxID=2895522 RepID=UPI001E41B72E|nr:N-acetylglucosamine-6-phosphate deacetylase [Brevibacillus humidisoli]UFJ41443.1 N-acetylglucosamine-6-phosphate deacetylase [Brevibacillus humidisoli]